MPPHKIRQEWLALDETAEVILSTASRCNRRPYPPFFYLAQPQYLSVMLVLLPSALWFGITACMVASSFKRWL